MPFACAPLCGYVVVGGFSTLVCNPEPAFIALINPEPPSLAFFRSDPLLRFIPYGGYESKLDHIQRC